MINSRSEGLSLTVVVIAAILLVVLIVLILIFSGRIELFNKGLVECPPNTIKTAEDEMDGTMCPGFKIPKKIINLPDSDKMLYCCAPTPEPTLEPGERIEYDVRPKNEYDPIYA